MTDIYGRSITYLRLSVTDLCNLRCVYCMPPQGVQKLEHADILSVEQIGRIVRFCVASCSKKVIEEGIIRVWNALEVVR